MLDLPRVVDAEPVGELHLVEGLLEQLLLGVVAPGARELVLVEDPESPSSCAAPGIARIVWPRSS